MFAMRSAERAACAPNQNNDSSEAVKQWSQVKPTNQVKWNPKKAVMPKTDAVAPKSNVGESGKAIECCCGVMSVYQVIA